MERLAASLNANILQSSKRFSIRQQKTEEKILNPFIYLHLIPIESLIKKFSEADELES